MSAAFASGVTIRGTGRYLPRRVVPNEEYATFLDTSDEWIVSHTGIQRRRIAVDEPTWYMGAEAAREAMAAAGVAGADIDLVMCTTVTPDYNFPSAACLVQEAVGAVNAFAFDVAAACAGSVYALDMARRYLVTGDVDTVLLVSCESLSQVTDYKDRASCILFGDGAGAMVLTRGDGLFGAFLGSDGSGAKHLYSKRERAETPFHAGETVRDLDPFPAPQPGVIYMNGHEVYRFATKAMPDAVHKACAKAGLAAADLDLIIPHQANLRIIQTAAKNLKVSMDKVYVNIHEYGNTSSATIQVGLDECVRSGRIQPGDKVCIVGFGSGLTYGAAVFEYRSQ